MRYHILSMLVASSLVVACSSSPTSPSPTPGPGPIPVPVPVPVPAPQTETRYDVSVTVRYIDISRVEACDGRIPIINVVNEGEFQYRIEVSVGSKLVFLESDDYNTLLGDTFPRGPGGRINFTNRTWSFDNLKDGDSVDIKLRGTEWDTPIRDLDLNDRPTIGFGHAMRPNLTGRTDLGVRLGTDTCGMTLVYDLAVERRQVPI